MELVEKVKDGISAVDYKRQEIEKAYLKNRCELGQNQIKEIEKAREQYFKNNTSDSVDVEKALGALGIKLNNVYLPYASEVYTPIYELNSAFVEDNRIACFDITRWVNDTEEKNIEKLVNVYQVLSNENCNIALIYDRKVNYCRVTMAIVNTGSSNMPNIVDDYRERVIEAIYGNFPGAEIIKDNADNKYFGIPHCLQNIVEYDAESSVNPKSADSVAVITNLAADKSEDFISQSMEKLLDGIVPENENQEYKLILLASPSDEVSIQKNELYEMYNALAPYATWQESFSATENTTIGASSTLSKSIGLNIGVHAGLNVGVKTELNAGVNFGLSFGKTATYNVSIGNSKGETKTCVNYAVKHSLEMLEAQIKRLEECSSLGMWKFAAYAISKDAMIAKNVATMYLALTQGEESYLSQSAINLWHGNSAKDDAAVILENLKRIHHPRFILSDEKSKAAEEILLFPDTINLYTHISGKELVRALNFPRKSVAGFPVIECAPFGREIQKFSISDSRISDAAENTESDMLDIGQIVHMYRIENQHVKLDVNSLTSHVFVTGSTGTGKTNTIYQLLSGLIKDHNKKVLVIEPAKGEYKREIGGLFKIYGTNPNFENINLLRINPFSFPTGGNYSQPIHVLEHIDRLVEIFNACWPMYAAMPAVLKDAIEQAYKNVGWNLYTSECSPLAFPTFSDLLRVLPRVIAESNYSDNTKSDYSGALVTRVKSLTNGINGLVFCDNNELSHEELFDCNVIVDISRVGSAETKAMLMGILVMKLQEYHMSSSKINEQLEHVTVIEEAHNLLRKTSTNQSLESANLQGKAVEMLTNSIAEMRSYGEGFIIVDQAPGLLDEAVIRNTNTKIILRLPDADDRVLVGKAAALNDKQIDELAKLPLGVAAVYQNDWIEAVLCRFDKFESKYSSNAASYNLPRKMKVNEEFFKILLGMKDIRELKSEDIDSIYKWIDGLQCHYKTKFRLILLLLGKQVTEQERRDLIYNIFKIKSLAEKLNEYDKSAEYVRYIESEINYHYDLQDYILVERIRNMILYEINARLGDNQKVLEFEEFMDRGLV